MARGPVDCGRDLAGARTMSAPVQTLFTGARVIDPETGLDAVRQVGVRDGTMRSIKIDTVEDYGAYIQFGVGHHGNALAQVTGRRPGRLPAVAVAA